MNVFNYLFYYGLIIPVSKLPFWFLYGVSNVLYYIFYYVVGYRKKVVMQNIKNSFPEKAKKEQTAIAKKFYRHFCDLVLESVKAFTISADELKKRMIVNNSEIMVRHFKENRNVIVAGGHYNNWELFAVACEGRIGHQAIAIYKPLTSNFFNERMQETRSRFGLKMISTKLVRKVFEEKTERPTATFFLIDQSPPFPDKCHWTIFLNQETGVLFGTEKYAKEYDYPVVFENITKLKRGHYRVDFFECCDQPRLTRQGEISEKVTSMLEKEIIRQPEYWLWSHKRWKQKRPANIPLSQQLA